MGSAFQSWKLLSQVLDIGGVRVSDVVPCLTAPEDMLLCLCGLTAEGAVRGGPQAPLMCAQRCPDLPRKDGA